MSDANNMYQAVLDDLLARRKELDSAIAAIERIAGLESSGDGASVRIGARGVEQAIRSDEFFGMSVPDAIKKYLDIRKRPQSPSEITKGLKDGGFVTRAKDFSLSVATTLRRLKKRGEVVHLSEKRQWGLAAWYPGTPKRQAATATPRGGRQEAANGQEENPEASS